MRASTKFLTFKGISVYLHFTLLIYVLGVVLMLIFSGMNTAQLAWSLLFLMLVFASVLVHEYGHALVAAKFGISAKNIRLYPIGGIASIEKLPANPRQELLISGAGPLVSFALAALCFLFSPLEFSLASLSRYPGSFSKNNFLYTIGQVNIALALINLIPAFPMDGGRMLRALLAFKFNYIQATAYAAVTGRVVAGLILAFGLLTINFLLIMVGLFILIFARAEESYLQINELVKDIQVKDALMYDYQSLDAGMTVHAATDFLQNNHAKEFVVMSEGMPVGTLNRMEVIKAASRQEYDKTMADLMKPIEATLDGNLPVKEVLQKLSIHPGSIVPVLENGLFKGVISFHHIIEYLLIHKTFTKDKYKARSLAEMV